MPINVLVFFVVFTYTECQFVVAFSNTGEGGGGRRVDRDGEVVARPITNDDSEGEEDNGREENEQETMEEAPPVSR